MKTVVSGKKDGRGNVTARQAVTGPGQLNCPTCRAPCTPQSLPDGRVVQACGRCGKGYGTTSMDAKPAPGALPTRLPR